MKGFKLDENGDVAIQNGEIEMLHGAELTMQTIKSTWGTQKGEWFLNWNQGIDRRSIMGKKDPTESQYQEELKAKLQDGLSQVDENLSIDSLTVEHSKGTRVMRTDVKAVNTETSETLEINEVWR